MMIRASLIALSIVVILALCGCSSQSGHNAGLQPPTGEVQVRITWKDLADSRGFPARAQSVIVVATPEVANPELTCEFPQQLLITREKSRGVFQKLRSGSVRFSATAHTSLDGTGAAIGNGITHAVIAPNTTTPVTLVISNSPIDHVVVWNNPVSLKKDWYVSLWAEAKDAEGNTLVVSDEKPFTWTIDSGHDFITLRDDGMVHAIAKGTAVVRATEPTSGKFGTTTIIVYEREEDEDDQPSALSGSFIFGHHRGITLLYIPYINIFRCAPDGTRLVSLTKTPYLDWPPPMEYSPSCAPNGGRVACIVADWDRDSPLARDTWRYTRVWTMYPNGGSFQQVPHPTIGTIWQLSWNATGDKLVGAYTGVKEQGAPYQPALIWDEDDAGLFTMDPITGTTKKLENSQGLHAPVWVPNSDEILCHTWYGSLAFYSMGSGTFRTIVNPSDGKYFIRPSISPDGQYIACLRVSYLPSRTSDYYDSLPGDIVVMKTDGSELKSLLSEAYLTSCRWSPDGKHIANTYRKRSEGSAYQNTPTPDPNGDAGIVVINAQGGTPYYVNLHRSVSGFDWCAE